MLLYTARDRPDIQFAARLVMWYERTHREEVQRVPGLGLAHDEYRRQCCSFQVDQERSVRFELKKSECQRRRAECLSFTAASSILNGITDHFHGRYPFEG